MTLTLFIGLVGDWLKKNGPRFLKFFTTPLGKKILLVMAFAAILWGVHHHGYRQGVASEQPKIQKLKQEIKNLKQESKDAEASFKARLKFVEDSNQTYLKTLEKELQEWKEKKSRVQTIVKKVTEYVPTESDSACTINAGFVFVHDSAARPDIARSEPEDVREATTVTLSEVARTVGENYLECGERGKVIDMWQGWYENNLKALQQLQALEPALDNVKAPQVEHSTQ